jgi:hypothetical protein
MTKNNRKIHENWQERGAVLAEAAAVMVMMIPLLMLLIYVITEVCVLYNTKAGLCEAARHAARDLAVQYGIDPGVASSRVLQEALVFDHVRIPNTVAHNGQFDSAVFETTTVPGSVKVVVRYTGGVGGLPPLPNPDPLGLGSRFVVTAESTYRLE